MMELLLLLCFGCAMIYCYKLLKQANAITVELRKLMEDYYNEKSND